jgi:anti-sigma factor RsiW
LPKLDAELKVVLARWSAVVGQGLPSGRVGQRTLALNVLPGTVDGLKSAVGAAGSGEGISASLGARVDGNSVHRMFQLVGRVFANFSAAARIFVVESPIYS